MEIGTAIFFVGMGFVGLGIAGLYSFIRVWRRQEEEWAAKKKKFDAEAEQFEQEFDAMRGDIQRGARRSDHRFKL